MDVLVLGMGNLLLADEGVGVHAVGELLRRERREGVTIFEVGTALLEALPYLEAARRVIVVDAVKAGKQPGTVYRIPFDKCARPSRIASMHGFDLSRVVAMTRRKDMPEAVVIGVEPARIDWSLELSQEVSAVMPKLIEIIEEEISAALLDIAAA